MSLGVKTGRLARKSEQKTARELGGRTQPASGATPWAKADVKTKALLIEQKDTWAKSYILKAEDLEKLRMQAVLEDRIPVFKIRFAQGGEYIVIDSSWAEALNKLT